jgi:hypothetical protein
MTKNGIDIQTISTKRTDLQTDRVLLFRFPIKGTKPTAQTAHLALPETQANASQNQKSRYFQHTAKHITFENL